MSTRFRRASKLDSDMKDRLRRPGQARARSPHWLMRQAIGEYVEREERGEAFKVAGAEAWSRYVTTERYVPNADADAWLAKLTKGRYAEPPACKKADDH